ncbi:hypothetical protein INT47_009194 [Mucor saturninus]|uniref:Carbohydrate kinase PfkB domain-containing protein n=1 Tax=Mucor saturninus TaxID=64648 RepID=A0A8H7RMZ4_9FUNG|nr:hypothetical protein INT47_009194 [Mucor saturninus]
MNRPLLVIGGIALDITATVGKSFSSILHTSTPGHVKQSLGGVGRNVAEAAWRTGGHHVKLVSVVGSDLAGEAVKQGMKSIGMNTEYIQTLENQPTAVYNALHSNDGQLVAAVADMNIFDSMDVSRIVSIIQAEKPNFVCFDGNITSDMMRSITVTCKSLSIPALFEPTSVPKSLKLFQHAETIQAQSVQYTSPNQFELEAMCDTIHSHPILSLKTPIAKHVQQLKNAPQLAHSVLPHAIYLSNYIPNIVTKLGEQGCLYVGQTNAGHSVVKYFSPEYIQPDEIKSVTGAGDCFVGTLIANLQHSSTSFMNQIINNAQLSSIRTLKSTNAVSSKINRDLLFQK